jgi:hypothetical protein
MLFGMNPQNQIKRTHSKSSNLEYVRSLLERNDILNRSQLAEAVCDQLGFHDARGEKQVSGCLKAMRTLETAGHFVLPESRLRRRLSAAFIRAGAFIRGCSLLESMMSVDLI